MSTVKKIASQTGFQLAGKIISSLTTLFSLSLITTYYGVEETGIYTLVLTYLAFFYLVADLGINAYILPFLEKTNSLFAKVLGFRLLLSVVVIVIAVLGSFFCTGSNRQLFGWSSAWCSINHWECYFFNY